MRLPADAGRELIDAAIGNTSWTELRCDVCEEDHGELVEFESGERCVGICKNCAGKALALFS